MIYFVTDRGNLSEEMWMRCMIKRMEEGIAFIIVRDKACFSPNLVKRLMVYKKEHPYLKTKILVHTHFDVAKAIDADGIHLPYAVWLQCQKEQGEAFEAWRKEKLIGVSIHQEEEGKVAEGKVDYMFLSPVFQPSCKPVEGKGIAWFKDIQKHINTPLVALGGITKSNVKSLYDAGINDVAIMSYLMDEQNPLNDLCL